MNSKTQLAWLARSFGKGETVSSCHTRIVDFSVATEAGNSNKYLDFDGWLHVVTFAFFTGFAQDTFEKKPNYLCNSCHLPRVETSPEHCKLPGFHKATDDLVRYNRGIYGPRKYTVGADGLRTLETQEKMNSAREKAKLKHKKDNKEML